MHKMSKQNLTELLLRIYLPKHYRHQAKEETLWIKLGTVLLLFANC